MTVVDSRDPDRRLADPGQVERTAGVLESQAEAVAERTRLLVVNEMLGNSFGNRDTDAADSYRHTAEVFGNVASRLRDELDRGRRILLSVAKDHRDTDGTDTAAELRRVDESDETGENR